MKDDVTTFPNMEKSTYDTKKDRAENIWQNLRRWKCDGMWSSAFDTLYTQVHLSPQLKLKLRRKAN